MALSSSGAPTADSTRTPTPTWCATCSRRARRSALRAGDCPECVAHSGASKIQARAAAEADRLGPRFRGDERAIAPDRSRRSPPDLKRRTLAASVGGRLIGGADAKQNMLAERPAHKLHRLWQ